MSTVSSDNLRLISPVLEALGTALVQDRRTYLVSLPLLLTNEYVLPDWS